MTHRTASLLLVEDDAQDAFLVGRSLSNLKDGARVHHVRTYAEAQAFLSQKGGFATAERPACVMVDLNLPDESGEALIRWMLEIPTLSAIPVIVFSGDRTGYPMVDTLPNVACRIEKPGEIGGYDALAAALRPMVLSAMTGQFANNDNFGADVASE